MPSADNRPVIVSEACSLVPSVILVGLVTGRFPVGRGRILSGLEQSIRRFIVAHVVPTISGT